MTEMMPEPTSAAQFRAAEEATMASAAESGLTAKQKEQLGLYGSQYLLDYFKKNNTTIYRKLIEFASQNAEGARVEAWLKNQPWYKDVNERVKAPIYAAAASNGITLSTAQIDDYRDMYLGGVKSLEEMKYDFGQLAIRNLNLDAEKPELAKAIRGGRTLADAVSDYAGIYAKTLGIPASKFDAADPTFMTLVKSSRDLTSFEAAVKLDPRYLERADIKQAISDNQLAVKQQYLSYGIDLSDAQANSISTRLATGQTSSAAIDAELRKQAAAIYRPFAEQINAGVPMASLVAPYADTWFRLYGTRAGLDNQSIRKAMEGTTVVKGDRTETYAMSNFDFEQQIMRLPDYQFTKHASDKVEALTTDILSRFGFIG